MTAFQQGLQELGWIVGRNVRIDFRWGEASADAIRQHAAELVALASGRHSDLWHGDRVTDAAGDAHCADRVLMLPIRSARLRREVWRDLAAMSPALCSSSTA